MSTQLVRNRQQMRYVAAATAAPIVWLAGPWDEGEFVIAHQLLDPSRNWPATPTLEDIIEQIIDANSPPEVILLAAPRPGMNDQELVDRLHALAPLTRLIVVAGSWCEGELRTGRPLAGVTRLYWHELSGWWREATTRRNAGLAPHWSAPLSHPHFSGSDSARNSSATQTVAIDAADFSVFETLAANLRPHGYDALWTPPTIRKARHGQLQEAQFGIWDGGQLDRDELKGLTKFCQLFPANPAPVLALVDYPRPEHFDLIRTAGATALLGKPYAVASLVSTLVGLTTPPPTACE